MITDTDNQIIHGFPIKNIYLRNKLPATMSCLATYDKLIMTEAHEINNCNLIEKGVVILRAKRCRFLL